MKIITSFAFCFMLFASLQAQNFKFGKVSMEEVQEEVHPIEKDANAAVLYSKISTRYELTKEGFTLITNVHERIKIYNKDGFDWATKKINYYKNNFDKEKVSALKGSTFNIKEGKLVEEKLKKDGVFEEEISRYQLSTRFTMPNVQEGSVIEYEYSLLSPFVTSIDDIVLQSTIPINKMEASVVIPEYLSFKKHVNPRSLFYPDIKESQSTYRFNSTTTERTGDLVISSKTKTSTLDYIQNVYSISHENIPSLKIEDHLDYLYNYAAVLKWELQFTKFPNSPIENYAQSWEGVAKTIYKDNDFEGELTKSNYYSKDLETLLSGTTGEVEKAAKIFQLVKSRVKWNSYLGYTTDNGVTKAYKEGEGNVADINLMLTSMLRKSGLEAYPVLVSTKNNGIPLFPTRKGFNYVIAGVKLNGNFVLLDATDPMASFNELPTRARNWNGRMLLDNQNSVSVDLMPQSQSKKQTTINLQIAEDFTLKGKNINVLNGLLAKSYRDKYLNLNKDNYTEFLEKDKGNIEILNIETENSKSIGQELKEVYQFELKNGMEVINEKIFLKPLLFDAVSNNPFKAEDRIFPIVFEFPSIDHCIVNIMVPPGYEVESLPENIIAELKGGSGTFKFIASQNNSYIRVESVIDFKEIVYSPADYEALKKFYDALIEKHSEAIVLRKS